MRLIYPRKYSDALILVMDESSESKRVLNQVLYSKTRKRPSGLWIIKNGKLFVFHKGSFYVFENGDKDKVETYVRQSDGDGFPYVKDTKNGPVWYFGNPGVLFSPSSLPKNAFPVYDDGNIRYIQITRNAIILTNGVFFSKDDIGENSADTVFIKKTSGVWQAWHPGRVFFVESGRMWDNSIPGEKLKRVFTGLVSAYKKNVIARTNEGYEVYLYTGDSDFKFIKKYPANIFSRVKVNVNGKQLYYPLHELCVSGWCP